MSKLGSAATVLTAVLVLSACATTPVETDQNVAVKEISEQRVMPPILSLGKAPQFNGEDMRTAVKILNLSDDPDYGYSEKNPIQTGGLSSYRQREYFAGLLGPQGQELKFRRLGSCCEYATDNGIDGVGLLDAYQVWFDGLDEPFVLYISLYDEGQLFVPRGLMAR